MDQLYAEDYVESGYAVYVADAITLTAAESQVITVAGIVYQLEVEPLSLFDVGVTANLTVAPDVFLESDTQFSTDAVKTGVADSTLDNIVNLSLQAARFRDIIAAALAETAVEGQLSTLFNSTAQFNTEAVFVCSFDVINNLEPVDLSTTVDMQVIGGFLIELIDPYFDTGYFDPGYFEGDTVDLPGQFAFACEAEIIIQSTQLFAEFALTADLTAAPIEFESALDAVFACDVTAQVIVDTVINISGTFAQTTTAEIVKQIDSNAVGVFEQNADAQRIRSIDAVFDNAFAQTVDIDRIRFADAAVDSAFDQSTSGDRFRAITSEQNTDAQLTAQVAKIQLAQVEMTGAFSPSITVDITARGQVEMETTSTLTVTATRIKSTTINCTVTSDCTATGMAVRISYAANMVGVYAGIEQQSGTQFGWAVADDQTNTATGFVISAPSYDSTVANVGRVYSLNPFQFYDSPVVLAETRFGRAVAADATRIWANTGENTSLERVYQINKATSTVEFVYNNTSVSDNESYGSKIAYRSDRLYVASPRSGYGRVYVYNTTTGALVQELAGPTTGSAARNFGDGLAVTDQWLCVGDTQARNNTGAVYVYNRSTLQFLRTIINPFNSPVANDFGKTLHIQNDRLYVASAEQPNPLTGAGAVAVFDLNTGQVITAIVNPNAAGTVEFDRFGTAIAGNDRYLAISARGEDIPDSDSGIVYVFDNNTLELRTTILNPASIGAYPPGTGDVFGFSLAFAQEQDYLAVGSPNDDNDPFSNTGSLWVYEVVIESSEPIDVEVTSELAAQLTRAPYEFDSAIICEFGVIATGQVIAAGTAQSEVISQQTVTANVIAGLDSNLESTVELMCIAMRLESLAAELLVTAQLLADADKIRANAVDMIVTTTVDARATQIFGFADDWAVTADFAALAGIRYSLSAAGFAQTSVLATGRIIDLNKEVWRITKENRTFAIEPETRDYTIAREQRVWSIT